jgi:tetratricopeptide (TPR) repeat protein
MRPLRKTAVLEFLLPGCKLEEKLPLTREREYSVRLTIDGSSKSAGLFRSPRNDEEWRNYVKLLRSSNAERGDDAYRNATVIRSLGRDLYRTLFELDSSLAEFLQLSGQPRRLVVQSQRPEIHTLPWGALVDPNARLAAAGDLSIVHSWDDFHEKDVVSTGENLSLAAEIRGDTQRSTAAILPELPNEIRIQQTKTKDVDIVHLEAHGNAVTQEIGEVFAREMADKFGSPKIALLWSCYSSAANSWGESPALCFHQNHATLVLSFQAELHNDDAKSISQSFYRDVFGPAASLDPESALVRIRTNKFQEEFRFANWASMVVYLRNPLDLSAVPLNGPRVPDAGWSNDPGPPDGDPLVQAIQRLQPGATECVPSTEMTTIPRAAVAAWKGVVILLDGAADPLEDAVLDQLFLSKLEIQNLHPADRLLWFFDKIASFASPLIVWTNALKRHRQFLRIVRPSPLLTFLLLEIPDPQPSIAELVDEQKLVDAQKLASKLSDSAGDENWDAAYFAYARGETFQQQAEDCISKIQSPAESYLLTGNFLSRFNRLPGQENELRGMEKRQKEEECYRHALSFAIAENNFREIGRAKQELAYFKHSEPTVAERLYRDASVALEKATPEFRDSRWHSALGRALRDRADLLAEHRDRVDEASSLLRRAMAIHLFHGRRLQMAYSLTTAARIAFTAGRYSDAISDAMDAANEFEASVAWRGWAEPVEILLDSLAELGHDKCMNAVADMVIDKALHKTNLEPKRRKKLVDQLTLKKVQALWLAGDLAAARTTLASISLDGYHSDAARLQKFLS